MDQNDRHSENGLTIDKDTQINVTVNAPNTEEDSIDLGRVFQNMKIRCRIFAWVLVLCLVVGMCAPLLIYQFRKPTLTVTSVVSLTYETPRGTLAAPDGTELDLSQITSSYVLQQALNGMTLSQPVSLAELKANISIEKVLTEGSRQAQEIASKMIDDKSNTAYQQAQNVTLSYEKKFIVRLTNGFGDPEAEMKIELTDSELRQLLDRILTAYNEYLVKTYADVKLPDDKLSAIDIDKLDILESLEQMRNALNSLYNYCDLKSDSLKAFRSSRDGRNLRDWMQMIRMTRSISVNYLYSYAYSNMIVRDHETVKTSYRYQKRNSDLSLKSVQKNSDDNQDMITNYMNDKIFVSSQDSDTTRSTNATTDYYNGLILQQANYYTQLADLNIQIADLDDILTMLDDNTKSVASNQMLGEAEEELKKTMDACIAVYEGVKDHMAELFASSYYTTFTEHTLPQEKQAGFLAANLKKIIIFGAAGAVIACGLWFLAGLIPEMKKNRKDESTGKEAAE